MNKKENNKQIRLKYKKEKDMKEYPDTCFCDEPDYDENIPIGETDKTFYYKFDYNHKNPFSLPIFKCNKCGKNTLGNGILMA